MSESTTERGQRRIEELIAALEMLDDPKARECAKELVQGVLDLHGAGLARLLAIVAEAAESGTATVAAMARDESVRALLLLHGLHPQDLAERVRQAVEKMRPFLGAQGIRVELSGASEESVGIKLSAKWHEKKISATALTREIETMVYEFAPEVAAIEIEGLPDASVQQVKFMPAATLRHQHAGTVLALAPIASVQGGKACD